MNKTLLYAIGLAMLLAMATSGCDRCDDPANPECRNYDPCLVQGAVSAEFEMFEKHLFWPEELPVNGKISAGNSVILRARQELDSYEWYVGQELNPRLGKEVEVSFGGVPYNRIQIRLVVKGTPNLACDPNDDGIDTVIRNLEVIDPELLPISGKFKGRHQHIQEEDFVIEIRLRPNRPYMDSVPPPPFATWNYYLMNLPKGTPRPQWGVSSEWIYTQISPLGLLRGGEGFWMTGGGNGWYCYEPDGYGLLSSDGDSLTIRYTILDSVQFFATPPLYVRNESDTLTFIGIRQ